ncbi:MAG: hypothetical protein ACRD1G_03900 [Acidimicrobiales bacterium]
MSSTEFQGEEEKARSLLRRGEQRWAPTLTVVAAIVLYLTLPDELILGPRWVLPALEAALFVPLLITNPVRMTKETGVTRAISLALIALVNVANVASLGLLVHRLLHHSSAQGRSLILTAIQIWVTNVLVFALWFWELDRGGPVARGVGRDGPPDFLFPQMSLSELSTGWAPRFVDYLYVAFTNASAFSPTDAMPLSPMAKMLMLGEATVALLTVAVVASRAVNILS